MRQTIILCVVLISFSLAQPILAQGVNGTQPPIRGLCPTADNFVFYCFGKKCFGQYDSGFCSGTLDNPYQCLLVRIDCCGKSYSYADNQGPCLGGLDACGSPDENFLVERMLVPGKGGGYVREAPGALKTTGAKDARLGGGEQ
jgi:hypothetical protein